MRKFYYILLSVFLFLSNLSGPFGNQKPFQSEKHEVAIRLVLVDVVAMDEEGYFVQDLKKEDFEIYEDGKKVPINSFELISFEKGTAGVEEPDISKCSPEHDRKKRLTVIFDSINTVKRQLDRGKPGIMEGLVSLIKQGREIMVLELLEKGGMKILQPFTMNENLITRAVKDASGSIWLEEAPDILHTPRIIHEEDLATDREDLSMTSEQSYQVIYYYETRPRFEKSLTSLLSVMNMLKDYPGRKSVLLVSGGFPEMSIKKIFGEFELTLSKAHSEIDIANIHDPFDVLHKSKMRYGDQIFEDLIDFANSHNITFYTLDPDNYLKYVLPDVSKDNFPRAVGTLRSAYPSDKIAAIERYELNNLEFLSRETGGLSFQGAKKFENFKNNVHQDLSAYYELSYIPPRKKGDGKYHKIRVEIKKPGLKFRSRVGYYDYTGEQNETLTFASASYNPSLFKDFPLEAWANPFIQDKDNFILWFNIVLPLKELIIGNYDRDKPKILKLKIWMMKEDGDMDPGTEMTMPIILTPETLQKLRGRPFFIYNCASGKVKLKQEKYRMIFAVHDEELSQTGTYEEELTIPGSQKIKEPQVATAFFGNLVEQRRGSSTFRVSAEDSSLQLQAYKFFPLELNIFRPRANIALLMQFFVPDKKTSIEPRFVLVQNGQEKGAVLGEVVDKSWNKKAGLWSIVYKLDFSAFPAGSYVLYIKGNVDTSFLEADLRVKIL